MGESGECYEGVVNEVAECLRGTIVAAWAVGGEVSFVMPALEYTAVLLYYCNSCEFEPAEKLNFYCALLNKQVFVYPGNVAFPFGGEGFPEYVVMELHYDNPGMVPGKK